MDLLRFSKAESDLYRFGGVETMISAVRVRPIIWDWSCPEYMKRQKTKIAWEEVCREVHKNYDDMDKSGKEKFGSLVLKRWKSVRVKYREKTFKGEQRNYVFSEHLRFLDKLCDSARKPNHGASRIAKRKRKFQSRPVTTRSASIPPQPPPPAVPHIPLPPAAPHISPPPAVPHIPSQPPAVPHIPSQPPVVPHIPPPPPPPAVPLRYSNETGHQAAEREKALLSFFKGLLPTIADFSPKETLDMQMEVLKAISSVRRKRHNLASSVPRGHPPPPTTLSCHPTQQCENPHPAPMQYFPQPQNQAFHQELRPVSQPFFAPSNVDFSAELTDDDDSDFLEVIWENGS